MKHTRLTVMTSLAALTAFAVASAPAQTEAPAPKPHPMIVGGQPVQDIADVHWQVALGPASVHGHTILGLSCYGARQAAHHLRRFPRGNHAGDELIRGRFLQLPQARNTYAVLGQQPAGSWGFVHGLNEHRLAIGVTGWHSRAAGEAAGLTGCELVRLALERSRTSLQAVEVLTDLIGRHGQCGDDADGGNHIFLVADPTEAFVLETAGRFWALQECRQTRAVTGVALTRQDWRRLSPGLAGLAIEQGWWYDDGSKVDFAGCLDSRAAEHGLARRRWGRLSVALAQQEGAIDLHYCRRLLDEQHDNNLSLHPQHEGERIGSFLTGSERGCGLPLGWFSFGPPPWTLYFPLCPLADLPPALGPATHPERASLCWRARSMGAGDVDPAALTAALDRLQAQFDRDAEALAQRALPLLQDGNCGKVGVEAAEMMQRHVDAFELEWRRLDGRAEPVQAVDWAGEVVELPY